MIGADAQGPAPFLAPLDQGDEFFLDPGDLFGVLGVGVFPHREFLAVGVVAGIDPDRLYPVGRFQGRLGFEVDIGDEGRLTTCGAQGGDDGLEIGGVPDGLRGDPHQTTTRRDQGQCLPDAGVGVERIASDHGLGNDWQSVPQSHRLPVRAADNDLPRASPLVTVRGEAIVHGRARTNVAVQGWGASK